MREATDEDTHCSMLRGEVLSQEEKATVDPDLPEAALELEGQAAAWKRVPCSAVTGWTVTCLGNDKVEIHHQATL